MTRLIRLHITGEGQTEERFVKDTLAKHLGLFQISTDVRRVLTSRDKRKNKSYRGGLINYEKAKRDIETWLKEDKNPESFFTTMFDLYALPDNFPAYEESRAIADPYLRVKALEKAFQEDIKHPRFIPYIQSTAPSKRILEVIPEYDKANAGAIIAGLNGVAFLKTKCPHFCKWLEKLEKLSDGGS